MNTLELPRYRIRRYCIPAPPNDRPVRGKIVRAMHPEVAYSWAQLYEEMQMYPIGRPPFEEACARETGHTFLAIEYDAENRDRKAIGMMTCTPLRQFGRCHGIIHNMIVLRQFQQRGVATELLQSIIAWTREMSHATNTPPILALQTSVSLDLRSATRFVQKHLFVPITEDRDPYYELDITPNDPKRLERAQR